MVTAAERMARDDPGVVKLVRLKPPTAENRSIIALELHSDKQSKKPGILIMGGKTSYLTYFN